MPDNLISYLTLVVQSIFNIHMDGVGNLTLVTGGKVAIFNDKVNRGLIEVYDSNTGQLIWNLISEEMKGMTEVSVGGKLCLAISFWYNFLLSKHKALKQECFLKFFHIY